MQTFISIAIFLVPVWVMMKRDFPSGLCGALVLFTVMPSTLCLQAGAFELTFQRILLLVVAVCWLPWLASRRRPMEIPFIGLLGAWWVANLLSFAFAVDHALSVKWLLSFTHGNCPFLPDCQHQPDGCRKFIGSLSRLVPQRRRPRDSGRD